MSEIKIVLGKGFDMSEMIKIDKAIRDLGYQGRYDGAGVLLYAKIGSNIIES